MEETPNLTKILVRVPLSVETERDAAIDQMALDAMTNRSSVPIEGFRFVSRVSEVEHVNPLSLGYDYLLYEGMGIPNEEVAGDEH